MSACTQPIIAPKAHFQFKVGSDVVGHRGVRARCVSVCGWLRLSSFGQIISQSAQNHALGMKSCHDIRSIDQGMGSKLAAPEPKLGVAIRVVPDTHPIVATRQASGAQTVTSSRVWYSSSWAGYGLPGCCRRPGEVHEPSLARQPIIGLWRPMPCGAGTSTIVWRNGQPWDPNESL